MAGTTKINGANYQYDIKLKGSKGELDLDFNVINALNIDENYFDPWPSGELYIAAPYNTLEGDSELQFRGDGTDQIEITIFPVVGDEDKPAAKTRTALQYEFTIVEEQNIVDDASPAKNMKAYTLIHKHKFKLMKSFPYRKKYNGWIGTVIQQILEDAEVWNGSDLPPGDAVWIQDYVPPEHFRYIDVLNYMLRKYVNEVEIGKGPWTKAFLRFDSFKYSYILTPLDKVYAKWKKDLVDTIVAGETAGENPIPPTDNPTIKDLRQFTGNVTSINVDTPGSWFNNSYTMNNLVIGYDNELGTSQMREVRLRDILPEHKKWFVDPFDMTEGKPKQHVMIEEESLTGEFKVIRLPYDINTNFKVAYADMMANLTFYNLELNANMEGAVEREPGKFMNVVKANDDKTIYDAKAIGTYFITGISHVFLLNTYRNNCSAIKTYIGKKGKNGISEINKAS